MWVCMCMCFLPQLENDSFLANKILLRILFLNCLLYIFIKYITYIGDLSKSVQIDLYSIFWLLVLHRESRLLGLNPSTSTNTCWLCDFKQIASLRFDVLICEMGSMGVADLMGSWRAGDMYLGFQPLHLCWLFSHSFSFGRTIGLFPMS